MKLQKAPFLVSIFRKTTNAITVSIYENTHDTWLVNHVMGEGRMVTRMPAEAEISQAMVVSIDGDIDFSKCDGIEDTFNTFFGLGVKRWVLDLRGASFLDTEGAKLFYSCFSKVEEREGRVAIICRQEGIPAKVLALTGLEREVRCFHDVAEAIGFVNLS